MGEADCYRELARAFDDIEMHRNLLALLPWTVHVDHAHERAQDRAARLLARVPVPRSPIDTRPRARAGATRGRPRWAG